ncbi:MAG: ribulose-phosphate 3-epimerase [Clostridiales bacterium]|nr:ribulose-phosphate 3-epimerase [Clostridiales bacterium]
MVKISPSILSCDYGKMAEELKSMEECNVELMHIDVMDGHFVPNITLGAPVVKCIKKYTSVPFDVHLMISNPIDYIDDFCKAGADLISFHIESDSPVSETIDKIKGNGVKAAIALKPKTPAEDVFPYLDMLDMVLVMTVEPGFGGQSFMYDMMDKVSSIRQEITKRRLDVDIEVDGGINRETIATAAKSGANVFVSGSALFSSEDRKATVEEFRLIAGKA